MSNSIRMEPIDLKPTDGKSYKIHYEKNKNIQFDEPLIVERDTTGAILKISVEGQTKLQKQLRPEGDLKKAGVTSARSLFEDAGLDQRNYSRGIGHSWPSGELLEEWMRTDEPETYAKVQELIHKSVESGGDGPWWKEDGWGTEEGQRYWGEASAVQRDWFERRCYDEDGWIRNPVSGQRSVLSALEAKYSDSVHDTTIGVYDGESSDQVSYLWEIHTKFNVLLPAKMLNELDALNSMEKLSESEKERLNQKLEKIDDAVNKMKGVEKDYEGTHMFLRFGVMINNSGSVTYHANYTGCEDENGISADSPEELLEKLMSK